MLLASRIFALIAKMKLSVGYTEAIGTDLGIVGAEQTEKALPKFSADLLQGVGCLSLAHCVRVCSGWQWLKGVARR